MACSRTRLLAACVMLTLGVAGLRTASPRFYPDDPIWTDDDTAFDAGKVAEVEDANSYDFAVNTFGTPGERRDVRALNVNTVDEVPDSSWFTNRIGRARMTVADVVRGPDRRTLPSLEGWIVAAGKSTGVQPGFRMTDPEGHLYQVEFDPPSNPEMASGAEIIGTAFYHAFGYNVVEVYLAELDPATIAISDKATLFDPLAGERRRVTRRDINNVLRQGAELGNGRYRVLVSRFADGKPAGNFRYYGTRPDDPNDIVLHEHRRELRGARVFGAWLNHDDSRGVNSLDMIVPVQDRQAVKHYMFDFGSILGSGTVFAQRHRAGNEYILEWKPGWLTLATLGFYTRPWMHIHYPDVPSSIGRFEGESFTAEGWKPEYPNAAFENMRPEDAFWAARIVSKVDEPMVRAVVEKARYSNPQAADYLVRTLMMRREKVLRTWLNGVNPLVDLALDANGRLTFRNAAVDAGAATAGGEYRVQWARFDNTADAATPVGDPTSGEELGSMAPAGLLTATPAGGFVQAQIVGKHPDLPGWSRPLTAHFKRTGQGWTLVGLER